MNITPGANFRNFTVFFCSVYNSPLVLLFSSCSVGCLWHSHGKSPVQLYPKLQRQPTGLPKIFIDYFFFQVDQWDCTKPLSICNRFASSNCTQNCKASQQDCLKSLSIISSSKSTNGIVQNLYRFAIDLLPLIVPKIAKPANRIA